MHPQIIHNPSELATLLDANAPEGLIDHTFSASEWLADPRNLAIRIGRDLAMFEHAGPGAYLAHVWFGSRGKLAIDTAHDVLDWIFTKGGADTIYGETPKTRRDAWLFVRMLGFRRMHDAVRPQGMVIVSRLTKERYQMGKSPPTEPVLERSHSAR